MVGRYYNRQGGVSRVLAELSDRAARDGDDVDVYAHEVLDARPGSGVRFVTLPMRTRPVWLDVPSFARHADRALAAARHDVVHVHDGQALRADVITAHSCYAAWLADVRRDAGVKGLLSRVYPRHAATEHWERRVYRRGSTDAAIVAISQVVADELARHHRVPTERMCVIHNGVDVDGFLPPDSREGARAALPPEARVADDRTVLAFVGMYFRRKGLEPLLRALGGLRDDPWELLVVGGDDEGPFRALAAELGIAPQVRFLGHRPDVAPFLQAADAFVFPTSYEPFGLVITEALACGTPVITARRAGAAELMRDGREGLLLDRPTDPEALRAALRRFLDLDPAARSAMRAAARDTAVASSWDAQWARYAALFGEVAERRREGRPAWPV